MHLSRVLARLPPAPSSQGFHYPLSSLLPAACASRIWILEAGAINVAASSFSIAISRLAPTIRAILLARQASGTACWLSNRSRPLNPPPAVPPTPTTVHTHRWRRRHRVPFGTPCWSHPPRFCALANRASSAPEYKKLLGDSNVADITTSVTSSRQQQTHCPHQPLLCDFVLDFDRACLHPFRTPNYPLRLFARASHLAAIQHRQAVVPYTSLSDRLLRREHESSAPWGHARQDGGQER